MSKKYMYLLGAALLALSVVGPSVQSVQAKSVRHVRRSNVTRNYQRYFVTAPLSISSEARTIRGHATSGIQVMLQNGRKTVVRTYSNRKTGRYTLTVPRRYRAGTDLRVIAKKGYQHPFRDVIVKTPANQKAAVKARRKVVKKSAKHAKVVRNGHKAIKHTSKRNTKKVNRRNTKKVNQRNGKKVAKRANKKARKAVRKSNRKPAKLAQTPTGTWYARQTKNYNQRVNFSQARGLNISKYTKRGHFVKKLITNAPYHVDSIKPNFWKISYKPSKTRKSHVFYMHLLTQNNFEVTNCSGRKANLDFLRA